MIADSCTHNAICGAGRGDHLHMRVVDCMYDVDARLHMADAKRTRQQQRYLLLRRHMAGQVSWCQLKRKKKRESDLSFWRIPSATSSRKERVEEALVRERTRKTPPQ